jgi:integrase/recombinase XerD
MWMLLGRLHPGTAELVADYLKIAGHAGEMAGALFRPVKNNTGGMVEGAITADGIYKMVQYYAKRVGVNIEGFGAHSLRATAATNALDHEAPPLGSMIGGRPGRRTAPRLR